MKQTRRLSREVLRESVDGTDKITHTLVTELYYSKGGMDYATYKNMPRGYYLSVVPIDEVKTDTPGLNITRFGAFTGLRRFITEAKRFSDKTLQTLAIDAALVNELRTAVLARNGLTAPALAPVEAK